MAMRAQVFLEIDQNALAFMLISRCDSLNASLCCCF